MAWVVGESQAKADYKKDYDKLHKFVYDSLITPKYKEFIENKFSEIRKYKCRDDAKLKELEDVFRDRYKHFYKSKEVRWKLKKKMK